MFPYPPARGFVGRPLGYIASVYARLKRLCGFNVLHPMEFTTPYGSAGRAVRHPSRATPGVTRTTSNRCEQLDKIGFSFDWSHGHYTCGRPITTGRNGPSCACSDSYYCNKGRHAQPNRELVKAFETNGTEGHQRCAYRKSCRSPRPSGRR